MAARATLTVALHSAHGAGCEPTAVVLKFVRIRPVNGSIMEPSRRARTAPRHTRRLPRAPPDENWTWTRFWPWTWCPPLSEP